MLLAHDRWADERDSIGNLLYGNKRRRIHVKNENPRPMAHSTRDEFATISFHEFSSVFVLAIRLVLHIP